MPYDRLFNAEKKRFEVRFHGRVTVDEIIRNYMEMIRSRDWSPEVLRLIVVENGSDLSELTIDTFQNEFLQVLDETAEIAGPPNKNAWVFESELTSPIAKVWELMPAAQERDLFRVFSSAQDAIAWLEG